MSVIALYGRAVVFGGSFKSSVIFWFAETRSWPMSVPNNLKIKLITTRKKRQKVNTTWLAVYI